MPSIYTHISDEIDFLHRFVQIIFVNTLLGLRKWFLDFSHYKNDQRILHK